MAVKTETPLSKQYNAIKARYPGALVLFRVGDFYETFGEDAVAASKVLDIVLTKRGSGSSSETELAGFPHHSLDTYLPKLVRAGHRVAICDQLEDPRFVKGIVKRGVTELVTPGVSYNDNVLERKEIIFLPLSFLKENPWRRLSGHQYRRILLCSRSRRLRTKTDPKSFTFRSDLRQRPALRL